MYAYTFVCMRVILPCRSFGPCSSVRVPLSRDMGLPLSPNSVLYVRPQISTERPPPVIVGLIRPHLRVRTSDIAVAVDSSPPPSSSIVSVLAIVPNVPVVVFVPVIVIASIAAPAPRYAALFAPQPPMMQSRSWPWPWLGPWSCIWSSWGSGTPGTLFAAAPGGSRPRLWTSTYFTGGSSHFPPVIVIISVTVSVTFAVTVPETTSAASSDIVHWSIRCHSPPLLSVPSEWPIYHCILPTFNYWTWRIILPLSPPILRRS